MSKSILQTFTTRVDCLFAVTFLVLAPEHPMVMELTKPEYRDEMFHYLEKTKSKSELERQQNKEKTGVFTGSYVKHPLNDSKIPIWVADFVLPNYGTGAVMGTPHDQRDVEFALKYNIPLKESLSRDGKPRPDYLERLRNGEVFTEKYEGFTHDSQEFSGLDLETARQEITKKLIQTNQGREQINYKFRDWVFSRQRYWGEPFPIQYIQEKSEPQKIVSFN